MKEHNKINIPLEEELESSEAQALQQIQDKAFQQANDKVEEYLNGWKRAQADLVNFKKDEARRVEDAVKYGNEWILLDMIDVLDTFEIALQHAPPNTDREWLRGIEHSMAKMYGALRKHHIKKIESIGKKFDPLLHEAVQMEEGQGDEQKVTEEFRAGYMLNEKVIRPARVKIIK
ncbi:MAG: nucleotide exchange factor GrpE [Patescibacteria group bacterium]